MLSVNSIFQFSDTDQTRVLFDDVNFVRAEIILLNPETGHVHALLNEQQFLIGHLSGKLVEAFGKHAKVTLSGEMSNGVILNMDAELIVLH